MAGMPCKRDTPLSLVKDHLLHAHISMNMQAKPALLSSFCNNIRWTDVVAEALARNDKPSGTLVSVTVSLTAVIRCLLVCDARTFPFRQSHWYLWLLSTSAGRAPVSLLFTRLCPSILGVLARA